MKHLFVWPHRCVVATFFSVVAVLLFLFSRRNATLFIEYEHHWDGNSSLFSAHIHTSTKDVKERKHIVCVWALFVSSSFVLLILFFSRLYIGKETPRLLSLSRSLLNKRRRVNERSIKTKKKKVKVMISLLDEWIWTPRFCLPLVYNNIKMENQGKNERLIS